NGLTWRTIALATTSGGSATCASSRIIIRNGSSNTACGRYWRKSTRPAAPSDGPVETRFVGAEVTRLSSNAEGRRQSEENEAHTIAFCHKPVFLHSTFSL